MTSNLDLQYEQNGADELGAETDEFEAASTPRPVVGLADAFDALAAPTSRSKRSNRPRNVPPEEAAINLIANDAALNDNAKGSIDRFGYRAYAEGLCDILKAGDPPLCVGLYGKWGSGKSFMISLIKHALDRMAREHKDTHELLQWFEFGYEALPPAATDREAAEDLEKKAMHAEKKQKQDEEKQYWCYCWYFLTMLPRPIWMIG
jgi:hypothetical protein